MDYRRWIAVGYVAAIMLVAASILTIPGQKYQTLTTSDSGWMYDLTFAIDNENGLPEANMLSRLPYGTRFEPEQGQGVMAVLLYRGLNAINPSVTLADVVKIWGPLVFALSIIPVYLIGKELSGDIAGASAALFFATMTNAIYWNKTGAFDRECIQILLGAWTLFATLKFFKASKEEKPKMAIISAMVYGIYGVTWSGSLFIIMAIFGGLILMLLAGFGGKFLKRMSDPVGAIYSSIKMHLTTVIGVAVMMIVFTAVFSVVSWQQPVFWIGFTQSVLSYVGVGGGGGGLSGGFASEEQLSGPLGDTFLKFYNDGLLAAIVVSLMIIALVKILWSRKPHDLYILAWFIVLIGLIWPDKGLARFERLWWPFLPVMAGLGLGTLYSIFTKLSFDPSWDWLKKLQNPFLISVVMIFFAAPFVVNAQSYAERIPSPTEWHGSGLDNGLLDAFQWLNANTPEGSIVATEWSFGHLMTGVARRPSLVDGAGGDTGVDGIWQTENREYLPPDYVLFGNDYSSSGTDYDYRPGVINGRRPDSDRMITTASENELAYLLKQYASYGSVVDYLIVQIDINYYMKLAAGMWSVAENIQTPVTSSQSGSIIALTFQDNRVVNLDLSTLNAFVEEGGENKYLEAVITFASGQYGQGYGYVIAKTIRPTIRNEFQIPEILGVDIKVQNAQISGIGAIQLGQSVGRSMTYRIAAENNIPPFLSVVHTSANGLVKVVKVNHSLIP